MLNNWCGQGRLARDVELRYTASQMPVASFTIACDRDYAAKDGTRETDWIDIVAWNKSAEFVSKYFRKGDTIIVSGRLQTRTYEDKNGNKRKVTEVIATGFNFAGGRRDGQGQGAPLSAQNGQSQYGGALYGQGAQYNQQYGQYGGAPSGGGGQYSQPGGQGTYSQGGLDGFMSIPDGIDEELPFT